MLPHIFSAHPSLVFDAKPLLNAFTNPASLRVLLNSALLSAASAILATVFGVGVAILVGRTDVPGRSLWTGLAWLTILTPSLLLGEGWELLFERGGFLDSLTAVPAQIRELFFSPWGLIVVLALKFFPFVYLAIAPALPWLGGEQEAAARNLGARRTTVWYRIYLPLLLPFLASGATLVFANVLQDFGLAATVAQSAGFPLISYNIYAAIDTVPTDFATAGALSLLLTLAIAAVLLIQLGILRRFHYTTIHGGFRPAPPVSLGRLRVVASGLLAVFFTAALGLPLITILMVSLLKQLGTPLTLSNLTLGHYAAILQGGSFYNPYALQSLLFSLQLGAIAATVAVLLGTFLAYVGRQQSAGLAASLQGLSLWVISAPGIVLGAGYIFAWNQPWLAPLHLQIYGTVWALLLAYFATAIPYVLRLQIGGLAQIDSGLLAAARVQGAGLIALFRRVLLPLLADSSLSLWLFLVVEIVFELPASQLLYPPGQPTVAVEILRELNNFDYGPSTALTVLSALTVLIPLAAVRYWGRSAMRRWAPARSPGVEER